ncbi:UDP-glucose 4-epimerase GalE [Candidatus Gracilibacteria bacterium]|nr:UDP-glucose 4-epimerase GalE [Candidatus Gracilibacteria bacterium]
MKTLLLTGGLGYIGSHNTVVFLEAGYEVIIFDNLSNSDESTLENIKNIVASSLPERERVERGLKFYEGDLRNISDIEQVFSENTIDGVVHFAGAKAVGESCMNPFYYYENNIVGSLNLFKIMENHNCKNIIFSSSATVYDPSEKPPFSEETLIGNTTNPYGTTKFVIENILRDLGAHKNFNVINLRYFNPVGAHKSGLIGEDPKDVPNNLLPFVMKVANGELSELQVFGDNYDTPDGTGVRDYIHVVDLARGHLAALKYLENNSGVFENINLGTGKGTSVMEMIKITEKIIGKKLSHKIVSRRSGDIASAYCSPDKASKLLHWKAEKTVEQAVQDSWNFIQKQSL